MDKIEETHQNSLRTEEVAAIIEKMPSRFSYFVTLIILFITTLLIFFGWTIKYPELIKAQISISATHAPVKLVSNVSGKIEILHNSRMLLVQTGEYIAVLKNPAVTNDVITLNNLLKKINVHSLNYKDHRHFFPEQVSLGELNSKYFSFLSSLYEYLDYYKTEPINLQEDITKTLLASQQNLLRNAQDQSIILKNKYNLALGDFKRDSNLFVNHVIDPSDIDKSRLNLINYQQETKAILKEIYTDDYQIRESSNKIEQLETQRIEKEREIEVNLLNSYFELKQNISQWEKTYVLIAPFDGKLEYLNFWKEGDFIPAGKEIFAVIPQEKQMYGQVLLPEAGAGKVKIGQSVIIKLNNFPYQEFGIIKGKVSGISLVTNQQTDAVNQNKVNTFLLTVELPDKLMTNYHKSLDFYFDAKGIAEIVTNNRRLYERLFDNLRYRLK